MDQKPVVKELRELATSGSEAEVQKRLRSEPKDLPLTRIILDTAWNAVVVKSLAVGPVHRRLLDDRQVLVRRLLSSRLDIKSKKRILINNPDVVLALCGLWLVEGGLW